MKEKVDIKKNKLEEFIDTFREEARQKADMIQAEIWALKVSLDTLQQEILKGHQHFFVVSLKLVQIRFRYKVFQIFFD